MKEYADLMGEWLNEKIEKMPYYNKLYQIMCFLMFRIKRKFTYKDMFLIFYGSNRNRVDDKKAKEFALYKIIELYKTINNKLPKGVKI